MTYLSYTVLLLLHPTKPRNDYSDYAFLPADQPVAGHGMVIHSVYSKPVMPFTCLFSPERSLTDFSLLEVLILQVYRSRWNKVWVVLCLTACVFCTETSMMTKSPYPCYQRWKVFLFPVKRIRYTNQNQLPSKAWISHYKLRWTNLLVLERYIHAWSGRPWFHMFLLKTASLVLLLTVISTL